MTIARYMSDVRAIRGISYILCALPYDFIRYCMLTTIWPRSVLCFAGPQSTACRIVWIVEISELFSYLIIVATVRGCSRTGFVCAHVRVNVCWYVLVDFWFADECYFLLGCKRYIYDEIFIY